MGTEDFAGYTPDRRPADTPRPPAPENVYQRLLRRFRRSGLEKQQDLPTPPGFSPGPRRDFPVIKEYSGHRRVTASQLVGWIVGSLVVGLATGIASTWAYEFLIAGGYLPSPSEIAKSIQQLKQP
jgi:hypothetical protein